ncbi:MAG: dihydropteroate synthase [Dehalococcoidaceae bacterium]|nr:dihydropteroate synthase [Dehalococcoidaceae bacterium]
MLIIGENINATRKEVAQAITNRDCGFITELVSRMETAGADYIDVNAGSNHPTSKQKQEAMRWLVGTVQSVSCRPLVIDSDEAGVIEAALDIYSGENLIINSVTAEESRLCTIGGLASGKNAQLIALAMGATGIPDNTRERVENCNKIMQTLYKIGMQPEDVYFDPLVMPVSVDQAQALVTLDTIRAIKKEIPGAKTVMGLSNISFGLPGRKLINRTFLAMAAAAGLDGAILDPLDTRMMSLARAADVLTGKDKWCRRYARSYRQGKLDK